MGQQKILQNKVTECSLDYFGAAQGPVAGSCEQDNEVWFHKRC